MFFIQWYKAIQVVQFSEGGSEIIWAGICYLYFHSSEQDVQIWRNDELFAATDLAKREETVDG